MKKPSVDSRLAFSLFLYRMRLYHPLFQVINKSGAWFSYEDQRIGQGRENVKIYLKEHPELMQEIDAKVRAAVKDKNNTK